MTSLQMERKVIEAERADLQRKLRDAAGQLAVAEERIATLRGDTQRKHAAEIELATKVQAADAASFKESVC